MFDEISIKCPKCGVYFTEQSKAGECSFHNYYLDDLPIAIAQELIINQAYCPNCDTKIGFLPKMVIKLIPYIDD